MSGPRTTAPFVDTRLAFTWPHEVASDPGPRAGLRARTLEPDALMGPDAYQMQACRVSDCSAPGAIEPELKTHGFTHADLAGSQALQTALADLRDRGEGTDADSAAVRRALVGRSLPLGGGWRLRVLFVAPEGFIVRKAGPNGLGLHDASMSQGINGHDAAVAVHADQDVDGTPVRQILKGVGPRLFHHDSPDRSNARSPLYLVNIWVPLEQTTRPLALMDKRSLDRTSHQARYALPTDAFLSRSPDRRVNDIWTFLHDPAQRWHFTSEMDHTQAYVFETLATPHGSFILPGEAEAEVAFLALREARGAVAAGDAHRLAEVVSGMAWGERGPLPDQTPPRLRQAIGALREQLEDARQAGTQLCAGVNAEVWDERADAAMQRVIRKSLEMRAVGLVTRGGPR